MHVGQKPAVAEYNSIVAAAADQSVRLVSSVQFLSPIALRAHRQHGRNQE